MTEKSPENEFSYSPPQDSRAYYFLLSVLSVILAVFYAALAGFIASSELLYSKIGLNLPLLIGGLFAVLIATIFFIRRPEIGVLVLVFVIYSNLSEVAVRNYSLPSMVQGLLAVLLLALFVRALRNGFDYLRFDALLLLLLVFTTLIFSSSIYAADRELTDERVIQYLRGLVLFFVLVNLIRTREQLRRVIWVLTASAAFLAAITVIQVVIGTDGFNFGGLARVKNAQIVGDVFEARVSGPLSDPNFYAQILVMVIPLALYQFWSEKKMILKVAASAALGLILLATAFTFSRAGAVAAIVIIILAALHHRIKLRFVAMVLVISIPIYLILPTEFTARLDTLSQVFPGQQTSDVKIDTSFQERALLMETAWEIFKENPVLGVGAGNYTRHYDAYARRVGSNISSYEGFDKRRFPHNLYLETAAELGLVGLLLLLLIGGIAFYYAVTAARRFSLAGDKYSAAISAALALSLIGYGLTSFFLHGDYLQYLWLIIALATVSRQIAVRIAAAKKVAA
jgi:putative inorganic carbon (hco3(-)) transporter